MILVQAFEKVSKKIDKYSPKSTQYSFQMSVDEIKLFDKTIKTSKAYLEFGMGGSTFRALQKSKAKIYSIDSSRVWIGMMREYLLIRFMENKRLSLFYVDIGPTKIWGFPVEKNNTLFPAYSATVFNLIQKETIDTVLVDGRFRVACTLKTILECHTNNNLRIMIHDFWNRQPYHILLKYLDENERTGTLGVFTIKKDIKLNVVERDYETYKCNFA